MKAHLKRAVVLLVAAALTGCGSDGSDVSDGSVSVTGVWARASAPGQESGAIYFDLSVPTDDRLLEAAVPVAVAATAEIHESVMQEPGTHEPDDTGHAGHTSGHDSGDAGDVGGGMMVMRELADGLALDAGATVSFEPGGYHVMLLGLTELLAVGDEFELTLDFERAGDVTVTVEVRETAP